ncbi:hypothetical protein JW905_11355 [bacterium]|nr:hypothetical protein [candidate division CSSED10-310 bacterium]
MPHVGIHLITLGKSVELLKCDPGCAGFFETEECLKLARWGAIGPDVFFWACYEVGGNSALVRDAILMGYRILEPLLTFHSLLSPLRCGAAGIRDYVANGLCRQLQKQLELTRLLIEDLDTGEGARDERTVPSFKPPAVYAVDSDAPCWTDLLRCGTSGIFAENLLCAARQSEPHHIKVKLTAHALGYLTHLAAIMLGHPYMHRYGTAPQPSSLCTRYLGELCIDCMAWTGCETPDIAQAHLHERMALDDDTINHLALLYRNALLATYGHNLRCRHLETSMLRNIFELISDYFLYATTQTMLPAPTPCDHVPCRIIDELLASPPIIPSRADRINWVELMQGILIHIVWSLKTLDKLSTVPLSLLAESTELPYRWWLYLMDLLTHDLYRSTRLLLVLQGHIIPFSEEVNPLGLFSYESAGSDMTVRMRENEQHENKMNRHCTNTQPSDEVKTADLSTENYLDLLEADVQSAPSPASPGGHIPWQTVLRANRHPLGHGPDLGAILIAKAMQDKGIVSSSNLDLRALDGLTLGTMDFTPDNARMCAWQNWTAAFQWDRPPHQRIQCGRKP